MNVSGSPDSPSYGDAGAPGKFDDSTGPPGLHVLVPARERGRGYDSTHCGFAIFETNG